MKSRAGRWSRFSLNESPHSSIPDGLRFPGNYAIVFDGRIVYIGESSNVHKRLRSHLRLAYYSHNWRTTWGHWRRLVVAVRPELRRCERFAVEARLIERLNPRYNIAPGRPWQATRPAVSNG